MIDNIKYIDKATRQYEHVETFGVVCSASANAIWTPISSSHISLRDSSAGVVYVPANEAVLSWDIKKGELLRRWHDKDNRSLVTCIARSETDADVFAVGYADGSLRLWDAQTSSVIVKFDGHRSAVTCLAFDQSGVKLASGSRDTDVIIWDLIKEQGVIRLRGHKEQITGLVYVQPVSSGLRGGADSVDPITVGSDTKDGFILSTSKDALIKVWDVASQYCIETHVTQPNGECWALGLDPDQTCCITAGNDGELQVWTLDVQRLQQYAAQLEAQSDMKLLTYKGTLHRQGKERSAAIHFHPQTNHIAVHGSDKAVELWRMRTEPEIKRSMARKRRRMRERAIASGTQDIDMANGVDDDLSKAAVTDIFISDIIIRVGGKVSSVCWTQRSKKHLQLLVATTNNAVELYVVPVHAASTKAHLDTEDDEYTRALSVDLPGHRTDVRALALSSDDRMLASASNGTLKIWNLKTQSCIRTLDSGYALTCTFLPGDRIVLVGTKSGSLELFDITSSTLISDVKDAHRGAIWSLRVAPDGKFVATGGADKYVKFWQFDIVREGVLGSKRTTTRLKLTHTRTMILSDDVLALCFTPDGKHLAVSTLDNTVKVFFVDSLKLYLNLYGHKLPVLYIAIASDSKLLASCSADKNIRLWGLDFGDCHRALFAHDDSVMALSFIAQPPNPADAHTLFSVSKDGVLKTWDADKFQQLQRLSSHHGEIWALAVSSTGDTVVTASHDRSIRVWALSEEPLFLEEEREKELEDLHDIHLAERMDLDARGADLAADLAAGEDGAGALEPSKQTSATLTAGEKITLALEVASQDLRDARDYERDMNEGKAAMPPQRHPLLALMNTPPEIHLMTTLSAVPATQLTDALLLLSYSTLPPLFTFISIFLERGMNIPLTCRVLFFLLRTHHKQVVASAELRSILMEIRANMRRYLGDWKETLGWNLAGLKVLERQTTEQGMRTVEDVAKMEERGEKGTKRAFLSVA